MDYICTKCGIEVDYQVCNICGTKTILNKPITIVPEPIIKEHINPYNIPFRKISKAEENFIYSIANSAPYYILKYGEVGMEQIVRYIDREKNPYMYYLCYGLQKAIGYVKTRLYIK